MYKQLKMNTIKLLAFAATMAVSMSVPAQTASTWSAIIGVSNVKPQVSSGNMSPPALQGTKVDVGSDTQPTLAAHYALHENIGIELNVAAPFKEEIKGAGSIAGTGKLGSAEVLSPTLFAKYKFMDGTAAFRPYVGLGLSYSRFQKETGSGTLTALTNTGSASPTTFTLDSAWSIAAQIGLTYALNEKYFIDANVTKTFLKTTAHFSSGQRQDITLDPLAISIGIGYRF